MPGINQLGGALTATAPPTIEQNGTEARGVNPQSASGLQAAPNDGVTGVAVAREPKTDNDNTERRDFAALAKGRRAKRDPKTGDLVSLNRRTANRQVADDDDSKAKANDGREKLKRRLNDLFAPAPRVNAKAAQIRASEAKAQSIAEAAAEVRERVAESLADQAEVADE